jgi:hypothetical protein
VAGSWDEASSHVDILQAAPDESDSDEDFGHGSDMEDDLLEAWENMAFTDAYHVDDENGMETSLEGSDFQRFASDESPSPSKRVRFI